VDRAEREQRAYDEEGVFETSNRWHMRVGHVLWAPNTLRAEARYARIAVDAARGGAALDVGCGFGDSSRRLLDHGAGRVHGVDVSVNAVERARRTYGDDPRLTFAHADVTRPFPERYDLIFGRSVLHHIDYREFLVRALRDNLNPGGTLLFMEPVGTNLLSKAFHATVRGAHTPDERPFMLEDQRWLRGTFEQVELWPVNFLTFPLGAASTMLMRDRGPDNPVTRAADRADRALERWLPPALAVTQARQLIVVIRKPSGARLDPVDHEHAWHLTELP